MVATGWELVGEASRTGGVTATVLVTELGLGVGGHAHVYAFTFKELLTKTKRAAL